MSKQWEQKEAALQNENVTWSLLPNWEPTSHLRFIVRNLEKSQQKTLQQAWVNEKGEIEWRDIEIVQEEE